MRSLVSCRLLLPLSVVALMLLARPSAPHAASPNRTPPPAARCSRPSRKPCSRRRRSTAPTYPSSCTTASRSRRRTPRRRASTSSPRRSSASRCGRSTTTATRRSRCSRSGTTGTTTAPCRRSRSSSPSTTGRPASVENAAPVLREYGWPAVLNVMTDNISTSGHPLALTPDMVRELIDDGWEIDSHSASHPLLTQVSADRLRYELVESRRVLQKDFGVPADFFCYPGRRLRRPRHRRRQGRGLPRRRDGLPRRRRPRPALRDGPHHGRRPPRHQDLHARPGALHCQPVSVAAPARQRAGLVSSTVKD